MILKMIKMFVLILAMGMLMLPSCKDDVTPAPPIPPATVSFTKGADVSWLPQMEANGRKFYDTDGTEKDCLQLLKERGMDAIRLRVFVNPSNDPGNGHCGKDETVAMALRVKNMGMRLMIDFHYSDTWADPGQQTKPAAWASLKFEDLKAALATHTKDVLNALKAKDITPEWVQVGNETSDGMLWPEGKASTNGFQNYADLFKTGYNAVKSVFPSAKVIVHMGGVDVAQWNLDGLKSKGAYWDVIGISAYSTPAEDWQKSNDEVLAGMNNLVSRYGSKVMICEAGMAWDKAEMSKSYLTDLIAKTKSVPKGLGVFYWEPQCYNGWNYYQMGAFDNSGKPTVALDAFK